MEQQPPLFKMPEESQDVVSQGFQQSEPSEQITPPDSLTALQQRREVVCDILDKRLSFGYGRTIELEEERDEIDRKIRKLLQPETVSATPEVSRKVVEGLAYLVPLKGSKFTKTPRRRRSGKRAV